MLWEVALLSPPYKKLYYKNPSYLSPEFLKPGQRVIVPLRKGFKVGILLKQVNSILINNIKSILFPLEIYPLLSENYIKVMEEISKHYAVSFCEVLSFALPSSFKKINGTICLKGANPKTISVKKILSFNEKDFFKLSEALLKGEILFLKSQKEEENPYIELIDSKINIPEKNKRQKRLVEYLKINGSQRLLFLKKELGAWVKEVIENLCKKGVLKKTIYYKKRLVDTHFFSPNIQLTQEQKKAINLLFNDIQTNKTGVRLLFGITGSGKTQVYVHVLKEILKREQKGLVLVPEVALGYHIFKEIKNHLRPWKCYFYHGYLPQRDREAIFTEVIKTDEPFVVVGTRSSIFLPYIDWKVIIIDEEHDTSFKQEEKFCYNAKDIAFYLMKRASGLLILGSATPDIKTLHSAKQGKFPILYLKKRVLFGQLPKIEIVNLLQKDKHTCFTQKARELLVKCVAKGEQAIILLNRRGYAPLLFCTSCKKILKCDCCSVSLTYHREKGIVLCHYCGNSKEFPSPCPECNSISFVPISEGTERVEENLKKILGTNIHILRLDRDSIKNQKDIECILKQFSKKKAQILLGTQMCSKGYHFPDVTLVIVVDADIGLNLPDYKAGERTFSLLLQVCGRAGREEKRGHVIIQTRNPDYYLWRYLSTNDYESFYKKEITLRKKYNYPPFCKLATIRISYPKNWSKSEEVLNGLNKWKNSISTTEGIEILGPAPAPIKIIKNRFRYHCVIKSKNWATVREVYAKLINTINIKNPKLKIQLDMDPVQLI